MDKGGDMAGSSANNSSDFVSLSHIFKLQAIASDPKIGSQVIQVSNRRFMRPS